MSDYKVAVIVGSNRRGSINRKLAEALVKLGTAGLAFSFVRIDDLPMYNPDLEVDRPAAVRRLTEEVAASDAVSDGDAGTQSLAACRTQERDRLGLEAGGQECMAG